MRTRKYVCMVSIFLLGIFCQVTKAQQISLSSNEVSASCKVRDGAVTRSFKITTTGKVNLQITSPVDFVRVSPTQVSWGDNKSHTVEVKVVFFPSQQLVSPQPWKGTITVKELISKKQAIVVYQLKCTY